MNAPEATSKLPTAGDSVHLRERPALAGKPLLSGDLQLLEDAVHSGAPVFSGDRDPEVSGDPDPIVLENSILFAEPVL